MTELKVLNAKPVAEWQRMARVPAVLIAREHKRNACNDCSGTCCHFMVQATAVEATRTALVLAIPPEEMFLTQPFVVDDKSGQPATHPIRLGGEDVSLLLRRDPDSRACVFKLEVGGRGRCGAYALRPGQCRFYPWNVEEPDGNVIITGNDEHCPSAWLYDESTEQRLGGELSSWREDIARDERLCADWNNASLPDDERTFDAFFRFAAAQLAPEWGLDLSALYPPPRRRLGSRLTRHET